MNILSGYIVFAYNISEEGKKKLIGMIDDGRTSAITFMDEEVSFTNAKEIDINTLNNISEYFKYEEQNPVVSGAVVFEDDFGSTNRYFFDYKWYEECMMWLSDATDEDLFAEIKRRNHNMTTPISNLFSSLKKALDDFKGYEGMSPEMVELYVNMRNLRASYKKVTGE